MGTFELQPHSQALRKMGEECLVSTVCACMSTSVTILCINHRDTLAEVADSNMEKCWQSMLLVIYVKYHLVT